MELRRATCLGLEATAKFATQVYELLAPGQCWLLEGPVGAGKTTFVRLLLQRCGYLGRFQSPTFTLVQEYGPFPPRFEIIRHADLYRLASMTDLDSLGAQDWPHDGSVTLIEWASRVEAAEKLATHRLSIKILESEARLFVVETLAIGP
jgi:tRNA threonylcarbamoyladenosine biosynthesis protein TsaE